MKVMTSYIEKIIYCFKATKWLEFSQFYLLCFFFSSPYTICWTLPQTNAISIESSTLFHLSQMIILWTNSFVSNVDGCICSKCNANLPWCLSPVWCISSFSIQNLLPNIQLTVPPTDFPSESTSSLPESPAWPGTHWKFRATREERFQIFQKDFGWRNAGAVGRRASADWESVRKKADWKWYVFWWEWHHFRPCTSARDSDEKLEEIGQLSRTAKRKIMHLLQAV